MPDAKLVYCPYCWQTRGHLPLCPESDLGDEEITEIIETDNCRLCGFPLTNHEHLYCTDCSVGGPGD